MQFSDYIPEFINAAFRDLINDGVVLTYLNKLIILSIDFENGLQRLQTVLDVVGKIGLIINWEKCQFLQNTVEFLGHIIENGTVKPSTRKTDAVMKFPEPGNIKQVQSFLGQDTFVNSLCITR